jgi:hypothetical protein
MRYDIGAFFGESTKAEGTKSARLYSDLAMSVSIFEILRAVDQIFPSDHNSTHTCCDVLDRCDQGRA